MTIVNLVWQGPLGSDFQSEVGEVFGKIGGDLTAKFGRRFSSCFCLGKSSEAFSTKTPPQISPSNFTTRFWVVAGPTKDQRRKIHPKQATQNIKVHLNEFFWTISVGFLTRVTGKKAKVRANFSKKFAWMRCFLGVFRDFGWVCGPLKERFRVKIANSQVWNNQVWELPDTGTSRRVFRMFSEVPSETLGPVGPHHVAPWSFSNRYMGINVPPLAHSDQHPLCLRHRGRASWPAEGDGLKAPIPALLSTVVTLDRVTRSNHWPNRQNVPKMSKILSSQRGNNFWTIFGHFFDFCHDSVFLGCPTICPLQVDRKMTKTPHMVEFGKEGLFGKGVFSEKSSF